MTCEIRSRLWAPNPMRRRPDLPDAYAEPFIPVLWLKVHEQLGRVPAGSTARFVQDGTLPGDTRHGADVYRLAS